LPLSICRTLHRTVRRACPAACVVAAAVSASAAPSVPFQVRHGDRSFADAKKMIAVTSCAEGGFLAAGNRSVGRPYPYLVRTRSDGSALWERTYTTLGAAAQAWTVVETRDRSGFVFTGHVVRPNFSGDIFVIKIDCSGAPIWAHTYGGDGVERGSDVIEARTGDPSRGTNPGDLVLAGEHQGHGLVMRLRADGSLVWQQTYASPSGVQRDEFVALTEARPRAGARTGDIVAVGNSNTEDEEFGFAARVSGDTGAMESEAHGAATYRQPAAEVSLNAVAELRNGDLVFAGTTEHVDGRQIYVARSGAAPAELKAQRVVAPARRWINTADAIGVVTEPLPIARKDDVVIAGTMSNEALETRAFALVLDPETLNPVIGSGRLYGADSMGSGLTLLRTGFAIAGRDDSRPEQGSHYLVNTDSNGRTGCELDWSPASFHAAIKVKSVWPVNAAPDIELLSKKVIVTKVRTKSVLDCPSR
jgi:hypothetical protein